MSYHVRASLPVEEEMRTRPKPQEKEREDILRSAGATTQAGYCKARVGHAHAVGARVICPYYRRSRHPVSRSETGAHSQYCTHTYLPHNRSRSRSRTPHPAPRTASRPQSSRPFDTSSTVASGFGLGDWDSSVAELGSEGRTGAACIRLSSCYPHPRAPPRPRPSARLRYPACSSIYAPSISTTIQMHSANGPRNGMKELAAFTRAVSWCSRCPLALVVFHCSSHRFFVLSYLPILCVSLIV